MSTQPLLPARYQLGESVSVCMTVKRIAFTESGVTYDLIAKQGGNLAATYNVAEAMIQPVTDADNDDDIERRIAASVTDEEVEAAARAYVGNGGGSVVNGYVRANMRLAIESLLYSRSAK